MISKETICNAIKAQRRCSKAYCQKNIKRWNISDKFDDEAGNPIYAYTFIQFNEKTGNIAISTSIKYYSLNVGIGGGKKRSIKDPDTIERITRWRRNGSKVQNEKRRTLKKVAV